MQNRTGFSLLILSLGAAVAPAAMGQAPVTFTMGAVSYGNFGGYNALVPFTATFQQGVGDFFTFSCSVSSAAPSAPAASGAQLPGDPDLKLATNACSVSLGNVNPAPATLAGFVMVNTSGKQTVTVSATDHDTNTSGAGTSALIVGTMDTGNGASVNDPIITTTGEATLAADAARLSLGGPIALRFELNYASLLNADGITTKVGTNWSHNFEWVLLQGGGFVEVVRPGGKALVFIQSGGNWQLQTPEPIAYQLASTAANTYQFMDPRTRLIYTFSGTAATLGVSKIQDRNGNTLTITAPAAGTAQVADGLGRQLTFTFDPASGYLTKVADQSGRAVAFTYTSTNLTAITDANGNNWSFAYTSVGGRSGLMTTQTPPSGPATITHTWDSSARAATETDAFNNTSTLTYEQPAGTTQIKDPLGQVSTHNNLLYSSFAGLTDPDGKQFTISYDANGRPNLLVDRLGDKTSATYHAPSGYPASQTDAAGNTTTFTWTAQTAVPFTFYNLTQVQLADGTSVSMTYDAHGNLTSLTDQAGQTWKYTYNAMGLLLTSTDPTGRVTSYTYNGDGTRATRVDGAGNTTTYTYDVLKRLILTKYADGSTRSRTYDARDNVLTATDERGKTSTRVYNANNQLQTLTDPLGKSDITSYDANLNPLKLTGRNGQSTTISGNALGLVGLVTLPAGETTRYNHDDQDRISAVLDSAGKGYSYAYDAESVLASITDALARKTSFVTDKLGKRIQITTPLGESYTLQRDKLERVTSLTDPTGIASGYTYDARGALAGLSIGGLSSSLTRELSGLLTGIVDANGRKWAIARDSAGRVFSFTDPLNRAKQYSYDARNRISTIQLPLGTVTLSYDGAGNLLSRSYSDGTNQTYSYDADNRLISATGVTLTRDADGRITNSNGLVITRDADDRIASITYAPGKTVTYKYNSVGLLASVTDWINGSTTFAYDAAHQLTAIQRPNNLATQIAYDNDGRIASVNEQAGSSIVIQRDAAGRITSESRTSLPVPPPGVLPLSFDAADQVSGFTYDAMGRVTADLANTYSWNLASQLTARSGAGGSTTASYDAFGLRTSNGSQNVVWNYATRLQSAAIVQDSSGDHRYYIYTPGGQLLYAIDASTNARHFYHFDETGSTTGLTNDAGAVTDTYAITPYGETITQTGATENPFTWQGRSGAMQEGSTGLYYIRARYYDSATARFLSPDPIFAAHPMQANPYAYGRANPMRYSDPTGALIFDFLGGGGSPPPMVMNNDEVFGPVAPDVDVVPVVGDLGGPVELFVDPSSGQTFLEARAEAEKAQAEAQAEAERAEAERRSAFQDSLDEASRQLDAQIPFPPTEPSAVPGSPGSGYGAVPWRSRSPQDARAPQSYDEPGYCPICGARICPICGAEIDYESESDRRAFDKFIAAYLRVAAGKPAGSPLLTVGCFLSIFILLMCRRLFSPKLPRPPR